MKFLIDENEMLGILQPLQAIYPAHTFEHVVNTPLASLQDVPLFHAMAEAGYAALITQDRAQIEDNLDEVEALLELGIHWIGRKQLHVPGRRGIALAIASHVAAMPQLLDQMSAATEPMMLRVLNVPKGEDQRCRAEPLSACHARIVQRQARQRPQP